MVEVLLLMGSGVGVRLDAEENGDGRKNRERMVMIRVVMVERSVKLMGC